MRRFLKSMANAGSVALVSPLLLLYAGLAGLGERDGVFWSFSQFLSLLPGKWGCYLRRAFYRFTMTRCHEECAILFGTIFSHVDTEVGRGVYIGPHCNIGMCRIEDHCTLGSNVHVLSGKRQHGFTDLDTPVQEQGGVFEKVVIGEDTWVGNGAIIMASVGRRCVVGAGAVVTKEVADCAIVAGNPARDVGKRGGPA